MTGKQKVREEEEECNHFTIHPDCPQCASWAVEKLDSWKAAASGSNIYAFGFVCSMKDPKHANKRTRTRKSIPQAMLLFLLTLVALVIQTVTPIALSISLHLEGSVCPAKADALTKVIGVALSVYFVTLTISMCQSKLRGLAFLALFLSKNRSGHEDMLNMPGNRDRLFPLLGIVSNVIGMGAAGIAQFLLFVKNSNADNLVVFLLQSLALQFVLTADQRLMSEFWTAHVKTCVGALIEQNLEEKPAATTKLAPMDNNYAIITKESNDEEEVEATTELTPQAGASSFNISRSTIQKVQLMYFLETSFLVLVSVVGLVWTITLGYCM